jgi:signal peptidase I
VDPPATLSRGRPDGLAIRARGPWRVVVAGASMRPTLEPGDWLLVDPTIEHWPRRGTLVVVREPGSELLVVKRVAGGPGDTVRMPDGRRSLGPGLAWLASDASDDLTAAGGEGAAIDSRRYGPVPVDRLVGRAWFRYGPLGRRIGSLGRRGT